VLSWGRVKGPGLVAVAALLVLLLVFGLRSPRPVAPKRDPVRASVSASAPAPDGPFWPVAVGNRWIYHETRSDGGASGEVTVAVTAEERTGFRLVEERGGRDTSTDLVEVKRDGFYYAEFETSRTPALLLPVKAPEMHDWECRPGYRATVVRETDIAVGDRTLPAFEVRYEKKVDESWHEEQTLTFARGIGIARKRTPRYAWELVRFEPAK